MVPPTVSVVIPAYNSARFLRATLDSVLGQTYEDLEVVVVDDGSTDDTPHVVEQYRGRILSIRQPNGGLAAARNAGMGAASGALIAWMDADDLCHVDRIRVQVACLARHPELVAVATGFSAFDEEHGTFDHNHAVHYYDQVRAHGLASLFPHSERFDGGDIAGLGVSFDLPYTVHYGDCWERLVFGNFIHPPTLMLRRTARDRVGWLKRGIRTAEDWDYIIRLASTGPLALIDAPLLSYRCHPDQMSGGNSYLSSIRVIEDILADCGARPSPLRIRLNSKLAQCHAQAARALASESRIEALRHLAQAVRLDPKTEALPKNLARILAGRRGIELLRKLRGMTSGSRGDP